MYQKSSHSWLKHCDFILLDMLAFQIAFVLSYIIRHGIGNPYSAPVYCDMGLFIIFIDIVVTFFFETYNGVLKRGYWQEFSATIKHVMLAELLAVMYLFTVQGGEEYSRVTIFLMGGLYALITYVLRLVWKKRLKNKMVTGGECSLLIVTTSDIASTVLTSVKERNYKMFKISGIVLIDRDGTGETIDGVPVVANAENAVDYVCNAWIDEVFINQSPEYEVSQTLMNCLMETGVTVHLNLAKSANTVGKKQYVEKIGEYTVLTTSLNYMTVKQAFAKRTLDIIVGFLGCILTGIIFIFIAPLIYIQSPGPIFFSQIRVGKNGKQFKIYKFRSMYMDAEERKKDLMKENRVKDGFMFKMDFDPRIIGNKVLPDGTHKTGIGEFIRKASLDEFPQFWNVLIGDSGIIGTTKKNLDFTRVSLA
mgnify:CR=1 FL=1